MLFKRNQIYFFGFNKTNIVYLWEGDGEWMLDARHLILNT